MYNIGAKVQAIYTSYYVNGNDVIKEKIIRIGTIDGIYKSQNGKYMYSILFPKTDPQDIRPCWYEEDLKPLYRTPSSGKLSKNNYMSKKLSYKIGTP